MNIDEIRNIYPIELDDITKYNSFEQILGRSPNDYTADERKLRWYKAMSFSEDVRKYWSDISACQGCIYLSVKESWCNLQGLPCTVNPILTFQNGDLGMACMGASRTIEPRQLKLSL